MGLLDVLNGTAHGRAAHPTQRRPTVAAVRTCQLRRDSLRPPLGCMRSGT